MAWTIQFRSIGERFPQPVPTQPPRPPITPPGSIRSEVAKSLLVDFLSQNGIVIEKESIRVVFATKDFNIIIGGLKEPISIGGTSYAYIVVDRANKKIYLASTLNSNYIAQLVSGYGGTLQVVTTYPSDISVIIK